VFFYLYFKQKIFSEWGWGMGMKNTKNFKELKAMFGPIYTNESIG